LIQHQARKKLLPLVSMANKLFSDEEHAQILSAIHNAEQDTSGEIRLFVEVNCAENVLDRAAYIFGKLEMDKTELRNGVLFYLATESRKFAILGDSGIHAKVSDDFWDNIKDVMQRQFMAGDFVAGLCQGISMSGSALKQYFPHKSDDKNELPDDIVFGEK
jgi:uncharacterized membrane protein